MISQTFFTPGWGRLAHRPHQNRHRHGLACCCSHPFAEVLDVIARAKRPKEPQAPSEDESKAEDSKMMRLAAMLKSQLTLTTGACRSWVASLTQPPSVWRGADPQTPKEFLALVARTVKAVRVEPASCLSACVLGTSGPHWDPAPHPQRLRAGQARHASSFCRPQVSPLLILVEVHGLQSAFNFCFNSYMLQEIDHADRAILRRPHVYINSL